MYFNVLSCFDAYAEKLKNGEKKGGREAALGPPTGPASLLYIFIYIVVPALGLYWAVLHADLFAKHGF